MGCSVSYLVFKTFRSFLEGALGMSSSLPPTVREPDGFLCVGVRGMGHCAQLMAKFAQLTKELGVPLSHEKTEGFLGIKSNTCHQLFRFPQDKLDNLWSLISHAIRKRKLSLLELQQLTGHFNFAYTVISPSRPFLRRLCQAMRHPYHCARVTKGMFDDLALWQKFLNFYNGVSFCREDKLIKADLQIASDAVCSAGFRVYFRGHYVKEWPRTG